MSFGYSRCRRFASAPARRHDVEAAHRLRPRETEIVNVAPNTTLGEVLGEVCTRGRGASSRSSRPGRQQTPCCTTRSAARRITSTGRFHSTCLGSRTMRSSSSSRRPPIISTGQSGECTLGLHKLEDGSRKTAKVDSSSSLSLLEVIAQLAPEVAHVRSYSTWAAPLRPACSLLPGSHSWRLAASALLRVSSSGLASSADNTPMTEAPAVPALPALAPGRRRPLLRVPPHCHP